MKTSRSGFPIALLFVVLCVLLFGTALFARDPQSEVVVLHVRVTDPSSQAVLDVPQSSFRVLEDDAQQTITLFSKEQIPVSYGLVIDNSGSMRSQLAAVIKASVRIVNSNKPGDDAFLVRFISSDKVQVVQDTTSDRGLLANGLDTLYVEGGQTAVIDAVYLAVDKLFDRVRRLFALQNRCDVFSQPVLQRRNRVEHRRARAGRQRFDQRRIDSRKQLTGVGIHEALDLPIEESGVEERVENCLLRHQLIADGVPNRLRETFAMPRNHALRPDRDPKKF